MVAVRSSSSSDEREQIQTLFSLKFGRARYSNSIRDSSFTSASQKSGTTEGKWSEISSRKLVKRGFIKPLSSAWSSPVVLIKKKADTWKCRIVYHRLNSVTEQDTYPLPWIDTSLDILGCNKCFSTLDLLSGCRQVPMKAKAKKNSIQYPWRAMTMESPEERTFHCHSPCYLPNADGECATWTPLVPLTVLLGLHNCHGRQAFTCMLKDWLKFCNNYSQQDWSWSLPNLPNAPEYYENGWTQSVKDQHCHKWQEKRSGGLHHQRQEGCDMGGSQPDSFWDRKDNQQNGIEMVLALHD